VLEVKYATELRPWLVITVLAGPCQQATCPPLSDLTAWRNSGEHVAWTFDKRLRDRPDSIFEVGMTTLGGERAIYVYHVGLFAGRDGKGQAMEVYSNAYTLHHNDAVNWMRVVVEYRDNPTPTIAGLVERMPREFLERAAVATADRFGQEWGRGASSR
jgi:hypothetical protein